MRPRDAQDAEVRRLLFMIFAVLIDHPDHLTITETQDAERTTFTINAHPYDILLIIGKGRRTAKSIRTLLLGMGSKLNRHFGLVIVEGAIATPPNA